MPNCINSCLDKQSEQDTPETPIEIPLGDPRWTHEDVKLFYIDEYYNNKFATAVECVAEYAGLPVEVIKDILKGVGEDYLFYLIKTKAKTEIVKRVAVIASKTLTGAGIVIEAIQIGYGVFDCTRGWNDIVFKY